MRTCFLSGAGVWLLLACLPMAAQTGAGSVQGTVKDSSGAVIPGSVLVATQTATAQKFSALANETGFFIFPIQDHAHPHTTGNQSPGSG